MIQILLCDDESCFTDLLRDKIRKILDNRNIPAAILSYQDPEEIPVSVIKSTDIFFLDIDFARKDFNGLQVAKRLREYSQNSILIFATNYVEYAPEGYEMQAFRYLLKNEADSKLESYLMLAIEKLQKSQKRITVTVGGEPVSLNLKEIKYLESDGHSIHIVSSGEPITIYGSLSQWEEKLQPHGFLRTQKSYLVNMAHIHLYQCDKLILKDDTVLPVSPKFYREQKNEYLLWKGQQ